MSRCLSLCLLRKSSPAFDIDLTIAPSQDVLENYKTSGTFAAITSGTCNIKDHVLNLFLLRVDESICRTYSNIACGENKRFTIPYTTYHTHISGITSQSQTIFIDDDKTNVKRIFTVFHAPNANSGFVENQQVLRFTGYTKSSPIQKRAISYNYRLGYKAIHNEDAQDTVNNNISLSHFVNSVYKNARPCCPHFYLTEVNHRSTTKFATNYESEHASILATNSTYSNESKTNDVIQEVSSRSLPISCVFEFGSTSYPICENFEE